MRSSPQPRVRDTLNSLGPVSASGPNLAKALSRGSTPLQVPPASIAAQLTAPERAYTDSRYLHAVAQRPRRSSLRSCPALLRPIFARPIATAANAAYPFFSPIRVQLAVPRLGADLHTHRFRTLPRTPSRSVNPCSREKKKIGKKKKSQAPPRPASVVQPPRLLVLVIIHHSLATRGKKTRNKQHIFPLFFSASL